MTIKGSNEMSLVETSVFEGRAPGPRLIVLGAVHGNETCGTRAIERLLVELTAGHQRIVRGVKLNLPGRKTT